MTDYRAMTPDALRREIAERLGWTELHEVEHYREDYAGGAWDKVLCGRPPGNKLDDGVEVPDWRNDANASLALPIGEGAWFQLEVADGGHTAARVAITVSSRIAEASPAYETADAPALACCYAWLAFDDRQAANDRD